KFKKSGDVGWGHSDAGSLLVSGTLNIDGTQTNPVVLTSVGDDTVGGDTDGNAQYPDDYPQFTEISVSGVLAAAHAEFRGASNGVLLQYQGSAQITDSLFTGNDYGIRINRTGGYTDTEATLDVLRTDFRDGQTGIDIMAGAETSI